jgi:hypothetical protein
MKATMTAIAVTRMVFYQSLQIRRHEGCPILPEIRASFRWRPLTSPRHAENSRVALSGDEDEEHLPRQELVRRLQREPGLAQFG